MTREVSPIERLLEAFRRHVDAEQDSIAEERRIADEAKDADPVTAMLMNQVITDEERHHELLWRMAESLEDSIRWRRSEEALPAGAEAALEKLDPAVIESVKKLVHDEREGARAMQRLAGQTKDLYHGLFSLLLETVASDSEKHLRILEYIQRRLEHGTEKR